MLLKENLRKNAFQNDKDDTKASWQMIPPKKNSNTTLPAPVIPPLTPTYTEVWAAKKANAVQISTPEVSIVTQRHGVFDKFSKKDVYPKTWADQDLRKLIGSTVVGKFATHAPMDFARKSLGEHNGSPFTQRIADAPLSKSSPCPCSTYIAAEQIQSTMCGIFNMWWPTVSQTMMLCVGCFLQVWVM